MSLPPRYIIRVLKSTFYVVFVCAFILTFIYVFADKTRDISFWGLITKPVEMCIFFALFGIVYPLVAFVKKDAMLTKAFEEEQINIIDIFSGAGYELESENDGVLIFRLKNKTSRAFRLIFEDMIEVRYNSDVCCVSLSGLRKDVYRLAKHIEYVSQIN